MLCTDPCYAAFTYYLGSCQFYAVSPPMQAGYRAYEKACADSRRTEAPTGTPTTLVPTTQPPTELPTPAPTDTPTEPPTPAPSSTPTEIPTHEPSGTPTSLPTTMDPTTDEPTNEPSRVPTEQPTADPTRTPSEFPTHEPTDVPTEPPTHNPTEAPTIQPTELPTLVPTTEEPTELPTPGPTFPAPTIPPTLAPSIKHCPPADVVFVMDSSDSISEPDWQKFVKFTNNLIDALPVSEPSIHVGLVEYNTNATLVTELLSDKAKLHEKVNTGLSKYTRGATYTSKALGVALDDIQKNGRSHVPQMIILLTDGLPTNRTATDEAFKAVHAAGVDVQIVTIGFLVNIIPTTPAWSTPGFPPLKMIGGYSELITRLDHVEGAICKLSNHSSGKTKPPTGAPVSPVTLPPRPPATSVPVITMPPQTGPCKPAGHLHMDFGGDIANFGDAQQKVITQKLTTVLQLTPGELQVTRRTDVDDQIRHHGALGHGKIYHPTKVQLNFKFVGVKSIELGHQLEQDVAAGTFKPLPDFPLLRLEMEEIYCTEAPTALPTFAPTPVPSPTPTDRKSVV